MIAYKLEVLGDQHVHTLCDFSSAILKYRHIVIGHDLEKYENMQSIKNPTERFIRTAHLFQALYFFNHP